jgi:hypothetical protein
MKLVLDMIMYKTHSPSSSKDFTLYKGELLSSCCCVNVTWKAIYEPSATRPGWRTHMYVKGRFDKVRGLF